jgi:hypothetical protein
MRVVLISCVSKKKDIPAPAKDLYISSLFKGAYKYAHAINADRIFILSAKHGLLEETDVIEPYNETLNKKTVADIKRWATAVLESLSQKCDLRHDDFVFLAGEKYRRYLIEGMTNYSVPLQKMRIGKQLAFYKENT